METLWNYVFIALFLNFAILMVDVTFDLEQIQAPYILADPDDDTDYDDDLDDSFTSNSQSLADPASIDTSLTFGDFLRITDMLISVMTFQYFINVLEVFPLPDLFVVFMRVIGGLVGLGTLIYAVSGRAFKSGP